MIVSYMETETSTGEEVDTEKTINFHVDIEESTFLKLGEWQQDKFNTFLHDSLQYLKDKGGVPISSLKAIRDKKL